MLEIFPRYVQSNHYLNKTKKQAEMRETWTFRHHSVTIIGLGRESATTFFLTIFSEVEVVAGEPSGCIRGASCKDGI